MNRENVLEVLQELDDETLCTIWNEYCEENNMFDDHIYGNGEFNETFQNSDPEHIAQVICYGEFSINDEYFSMPIYLFYQPLIQLLFFLSALHVGTIVKTFYLSTIDVFKYLQKFI